MEVIKTENLCKNFGELEVLKDCSLTINQGEVVCIIGPSGAGKSTYLRSLNHLEKITSGKVWVNDVLLDNRIDGVNQIKMPIKERTAHLLEMGMVFQRFNLFPHLTVLENVMLAPIEIQKKKKEDVKPDRKSVV